jgi:predicted transposase/invertase (TIGR01784 family)
MKYLDVKTDYAFKKAFGSENSKKILLSFLNSLIVFEDNQEIVDLTIVDPYQIPLIQGMKDTYVDVKAILSNGTRVIIEMQVLNVEGFEKRVLYNAAKAYCTQLKKSEKFATLEPIIALTITDFYMFENIENIITYFKLIEKDTLIQYNNDIQLIFIELPKFTKTDLELSTITDKWIYFIQNAWSLEYIPESLQGEEEIVEAFEIINEAAMSDEELDLQWKRQEFILMQKGALDHAKNQGIKEGVKNTAKKMLEIGIDKQVIRQVTGLSEGELEDLG